MSTVRVICRPEVAVGFGLAGLTTIETRTPTESAALLSTLFETPDVGVVLIQQDLYDALPAATRRSLGRRPVPIVVPFPPPSSAGERAEVEAYLVEILRQAIGYRVRLR